MDEPISTTQRVINHILLPFAVILIIIGIIVLLILSEVLLFFVVPLFAAYQAITDLCCCNWFMNLIMVIIIYPLIVVGVFVYGQTFVIAWFFGWCDFGARSITYLKR